MNLKTLTNFISQTKIQFLILIAIVFLSYANILGNGISFDDRDFFLDWPAIRNSASGLSAFLNLPDLLAGDLPAHHRGVYRPVRSVYYLLNMQLFGFNPFAFHLQSILIHTLITILVYLISNILTKNRSIAFICALFFAAHPIHTEAITYTAASFDTLGILFFFASFYFYLKSQTGNSDQKSALILSWLLAFLAFFTYEMTLTLPFLIIAYEFCFNKLTFKNITSRLKIYAPFFIILGSYLAVRFLLLHIGSRGDYLGGTALPASNQAKLGMIEIIFTYLKLLIFPYHLTVAYSVPDYTFSLFYKITTTLNPSGFLLEITAKYILLFPPLILVSLLLYALKLKKYPILLFSVSWFLISLSTVLNIVPQGAVIAERFTYIPSFGFTLILAYLIYALSQLRITKDSKMVVLLLLVSLITSFYTVRTIVRNKDWYSQETIFLSAIRDNPKAFIPHAALGLLKLEEKNYDESIKFTQAALDLNPGAPDLYYRLGLAYHGKGEPSQAIKHHTQALKLENNYFYSNIQLGNIYKSQNLLDLSLTEYNNALKIEPSNFEARFNKGVVYMQQERLDEALNEFNQASKVNPYIATTFSNIGFIEDRRGNLQGAVDNYYRAVSLEPDNYYINYNLAEALKKSGQLEKAETYFNKASLLEYQKY